MPCTDDARTTMLAQFATRLGMIALGTEVGPDYSVVLRVAAGRWGQRADVLENADEIVFGRALDDAEAALTTWFIYDMADQELASDRLDRPIMLRKGERATFPAGSLRLELK